MIDVLQRVHRYCADSELKFAKVKNGGWSITGDDVNHSFFDLVDVHYFLQSEGY